MAIHDTVRVVVVDDVPDAADMLALRLQLDGHQVRTAYTAEQAVLEIENHHPHCVLLDICMPGMDGYELATLLRHRFKNDVVLIAVTGADETQASVSNTFSVVDHYLRKPVDPNDLRKLLG
jgi:DNA-binding response OmpR family regulator